MDQRQRHTSNVLTPPNSVQAGVSEDTRPVHAATFPSVTLRAQSPVELDPFYLVSNQPPGTQFVAIWGATATNVTGRVVGEFDLVVGDAPNVAVLMERLNRFR